MQCQCNGKPAYVIIVESEDLPRVNPSNKARSASRQNLSQTCLRVQDFTVARAAGAHRVRVLGLCI